MRILFSILALLFASGLHAQHRYDESFVKMKRELNLSKSQETQIKKIDRSSENKIGSLSKLNLDDKQLAIRTNKIEEDRKKKIMALLNSDQQQRWEMILNNIPRRGVTDRPNE